MKNDVNPQGELVESRIILGEFEIFKFCNFECSIHFL